MLDYNILGEIIVYELFFSYMLYISIANPTSLKNIRF